MNISFNNFVDTLLHICKNTTYTKHTKIEKLEKHITSDRDYLSIHINCDDKYLVNIWLGLSRNDDTKNEKYYNVCGLTVDIDKLYNVRGFGDGLIRIFNNCCIAIEAYAIRVTFLKDEVISIL